MKNRPLIVILTNNRPKILERCIQFAANSEINCDANWIVIDDSLPKITNQNLLVLRRFAKKGMKISHLTNNAIKRLIQNFSLVSSEVNYHIVFGKESARDISGLRNLALLFSLILKPSVTFFLDDDIVFCPNLQTKNEPCFFELAEAKYKKHANCIIGCSIAGILDDSYGGRIYYLSELGKDALLSHEKRMFNSNTKWRFHNNPLWMDPPLEDDYVYTTHTSAGAIALKLDPKTVIPFPSGYNEDWNWCLLQSMLHKTKIFTGVTNVFHSPPAIFSPNQEEFVWEQFGEILFSSLSHTRQLRTSGSIHDICKKTKQGATVKYSADELFSTIQMIDRFIKETNNFSEHKKLTKYKQEIKHTLKAVQNINTDKLVDSWFNALIMRSRVFSFILNNKDLHKQIKNIIHATMVQ